MDDTLRDTFKNIKAREKTKAQPKIEAQDEKKPAAEKVLEGQSKEEPKTQVIEPASPAPTSWPDALKAEWASISPALRQHWQKRELDIQKGLRSAAEQTKRFEPIDKVLAPHKDMLTQYYGSVEKGLDDFFKLHEISVRDPIGFVSRFLQSRGINPAQLSTLVQGQPQGQAQDPNIAALLNKVNELEGRLKQDQEEKNNQVQGQAAKAWDDFSSNKANIHLEEVKDTMAELLQAGLAESYQDAYDKAVHMRADLREKIWSEKIDAVEKKRREDAEKQLQQARKAATIADVTRPNAGVTPSKAKSWEDTLRDKHSKMFTGAA